MDYHFPSHVLEAIDVSGELVKVAVREDILRRYLEQNDCKLGFKI